MKIEVYGDRMLLVFDPVQEKTVNGIVVADKHSERTRLATVKDVGAEVKRYKIGDRVIVSPYTGVRLHLMGHKMDGVPIDEETFRIAREEEMLGKVIEE